MNINSKDYCDNKQCPLHTESEINRYRYKISTTYIKVNVTENDEINVSVPCLMCKHAKKLDFGNIMRKFVTKVILKDGVES